MQDSLYKITFSQTNGESSEVIIDFYICSNHGCSPIKQRIMYANSE